MSFALPTTITIVNKYPEAPRITRLSRPPSGALQSIWQVVDDDDNKYGSFRELVKIAHMEDILNDPQTKLTMFVPLDFILPKTTISSCFDHIESCKARRSGDCASGAISTDVIKEKDILAIDFETARTIVNSLIIPSILSTTMMIQSAFRRYKTRNTINTLTVETPHCVQFEPQTFNKPPFGIVLNGRSRILTPDILASNGLLHTIDRSPYI